MMRLEDVRDVYSLFGLLWEGSPGSDPTGFELMHKRHVMLRKLLFHKQNALLSGAASPPIMTLP